MSRYAQLVHRSVLKSVTFCSTYLQSFAIPDFFSRGAPQLFRRLQPGYNNSINLQLKSIHKLLSFQIIFSNDLNIPKERWPSFDNLLTHYMSSTTIALNGNFGFFTDTQQS